MPRPTPFHPRTAALCESHLWKQWAGYLAVKSFDTCHESEYVAFRHAAGMIDVTPLFKYDVRGRDAGRLLARVLVRDPRRLKDQQVAYTCWCDAKGKVLDDGTVMRLGEDWYRVTAAAPSFEWIERHGRGLDVAIEDVSDSICTLAVQGPQSRGVLAAAAEAPVENLRFFRGCEGKIGGAPVRITRTGYTGDLGYEVWTANEHALTVWDEIFAKGRAYGLEACGLDALDVTRVEAGFIMADVDYWASKDCWIESRKTSPFEIGLGWTVQLDREPFIGQEALNREKAEGSPRALVGLEIDWEETEALFDRKDLPPQLPSGAWRTPVPVYCDGAQVGRASSGAWSPVLKRNLALALVSSEHAALGTELEIETTVEFERHTVTARVAKTPFFDPERKKSVPGAPKKEAVAS